LREADLAVPDGVGITLAVRWLRQRRSPDGSLDRVTGVDITEMVAAISATERVPVFLLGAGAGVAEPPPDTSRPVTQGSCLPARGRRAPPTRPTMPRPWRASVPPVQWSCSWRMVLRGRFTGSSAIRGCSPLPACGWRSVSAGRWISYPGRSTVLRHGCSGRDSSGCIGCCESPGDGGANWRCHALPGESRWQGPGNGSGRGAAQVLTYDLARQRTVIPAGIARRRGRRMWDVRIPHKVAASEQLLEVRAVSATESHALRVRNPRKRSSPRWRKRSPPRIPPARYLAATTRMS